jgi:hypothetical protein
MTSEPTERSEDLPKSEWRHIAELYARFAVVTGIPCAGLSIYLWTPTIVVGWFYCVIALPIIMCAITVLWGVTVYPFLLLLGALVGRGNTSAGSADPDGPGVIICPFGSVPGSRARRPNKAAPGVGDHGGVR